MFNKFINFSRDCKKLRENMNRKKQLYHMSTQEKISIRKSVVADNNNNNSTRFEVEYHVDRLAVMRNLFVQTSQIKLVLDVILVDLYNRK